MRFSIFVLLIIGLLSCPPRCALAQTPGGIEITAFFDDARGPLKAGDTLHVTLQGTFGGRATFAIPGLVEHRVMSETSRGVYIGQYTIPRNVSLSAAAVVGQLHFSGIDSPLVSADNPLVIDSLAPHLTFVSPARGATVENNRPQVFAAMSDLGGTGVSADAVRLTLDGVDVTKAATVTSYFLSWTPTQPLLVGQHRVNVYTSDAAGNSQMTAWQFTVEPPGLVSSFLSDAAPDAPVATDQTIVFTLHGQPGGQCNVQIADFPVSIPLVEGKIGIYSGEYTVVRGTSIEDGPVVAQFKSAGGARVAVPLSEGLTLVAGPPPQPRITYPPIDDILAGDMLTVEGRAAPGSTIRVGIEYSTTALGGQLPIHGTAPAKEVITDRGGVWRADNIPLTMTSLLLPNQNTFFSITAATVGLNGNLSRPAKISVRRG